MVIFIVRSAKRLCRVFYFLKKSKMAAKIINFGCFFHIRKGFMFIWLSPSSQMLTIMAKTTKGTWPICYFWEKCKMAAKKADFGGFSLRKVLYTHLRAYLCHRLPSVWHPPQDLFIRYFGFQKTIKMAAKMVCFWRFFYFYDFSFPLGAF